MNKPEKNALKTNYEKHRTAASHVLRFVFKNDCSAVLDTPEIKNCLSQQCRKSPCFH